jgi:hypothetical protein
MTPAAIFAAGRHDTISVKPVAAPTDGLDGVDANGSGGNYVAQRPLMGEPHA